MSNPQNPVPPVRPAPTGPPQPDRPVGPADDPALPDTLLEPNLDPPPTDPPVEMPSDKPTQPPPPMAHDGASEELPRRRAGSAANRHLRLVRPRRRRRRPTCVVGEITFGWRGVRVLQSGELEKP